MVVVTTEYLSKKDIAFLKKYSRFVLNKFVRKSVQNNSRINIKVVSAEDMRNDVDVEDLKRYRAWCTYDNVSEGKKYFSVILNIKQINKNAKRPETRLKKMMIDLGHELVHIKQYLNNEIFDYRSGDIRFKGSYFDSSYSENEELYYDSPWEIEAYGREQGLYMMFCSKLKEERLSK
jgi:hypothetical protein